MKRRLFYLAVAVALGCFFAVAALWAWSYHRAAYLTTERGPRGETRYFVEITRGTAFLGFHQQGAQKVRGRFYWSLSSPSRALTGREGFGTVHFDRLGFRVWTGRDSGHFYLNLFVPMWLVCSLFGLFPLLVLARRLRSRRPAFGRCAHCGYDLRATPDKCPECGHVPSRGEPAAG